MKRCLVTLVVLGTLATGAGADTLPDSFYAGVHGGAGFPSGDGSDALTTGYLAGGELGYRFMTHMRVEGEITYFNNDFNFEHTTAAVNTMAYMANFYYDIPVNLRFTPFLGVGIGDLQAWLSESNTTSPDTNTFAYQFMAGLGFNPTNSLFLTLKYRYLSGTGSGDSQHFADSFNTIELGLDYMFMA